MLIRFNREKLSSAFSTAASVAPSRSPKPILQNVKLEAAADGVTLSATDLEVGIRIEVDGAEVETDGDAILPAKRFGLIIRESSDETITLSSDASNIIVKGAASKFQLPSQDPKEFPKVAEFLSDTYYEITSRAFNELVRRTVYATDTESSRYALGGVLLEISGGNVTGVGTDGRRLASQALKASVVGVHGTCLPVVPSRSMQLIERALPDDDSDVLLSVDENSVIVKSGGLTIYSRLVEGRFPKWRDVFPKESPTEITMPVGAFRSAVRQAAIVTTKERQAIEFGFDSGKLTLSGNGAEAGESKVEIPIAYHGEQMSLTLNPQWVIEFLGVLNPEATFTMKLYGEESAVVCSTDDGFDYVIMPLSS